MANEAPIPVATGDAFEKGKFFIIEPSFRGGGKIPGLEIANKGNLRLPGTYTIEPPNGDPNQYSERPQLVQVPEIGGMPRDFEDLFGMWIVSERLKRVFESTDPGAFAFAACDFTLADGSAGPPYYFCGVLRSLDVLDEDASRLKIEIGDFVNGKYYDRSGGASLIFRKDAVGSAHVFLTPFALDVFCDHVLRDAVVASGVQGVRFTDVVDC